MRDNLDLHELRERVEHYKAKQRGIRNKSLVLLVGILVLLIIIWSPADMELARTSFQDYLNIWNISIAFFPLIILFILLFV